MRRRIECEWARLAGYKHLPRGSVATAERSASNEATLAAELGFDARYLDSVPFFNTPGYEIANQATFHPRKYLAALASRIDGGGSHIFEHSESREICDAPLSVKANGHTITCGTS